MCVCEVCVQYYVSFCIYMTCKVCMLVLSNSYSENDPYSTHLWKHVCTHVCLYYPCMYVFCMQVCSRYGTHD